MIKGIVYSLPDASLRLTLALGQRAGPPARARLAILQSFAQACLLCRRPPAAPARCLQYRNEELYRLQEISPGTSYRILTTVLTTAMHGEKFR